jgi:hypothetical protein
VSRILGCNSKKVGEKEYVEWPGMDCPIRFASIYNVSQLTFTAKLQFEAELQNQSSLSWTSVRPTAFMKSVSGQLEVIQQGAPFVMFGDGEVTSCNPIAESELAQYLIDCLTVESRKNKCLNLGGPDEPLTMKKQGEVRFFNSWLPAWDAKLASHFLSG